MAESLVSLFLRGLTSVSQEAIRLMGSVWRSVTFIRDELESMRAFLKVADTCEEDELEIIVWVKQVRDVVYDMEDVLEEFTQSLQNPLVQRSSVFPLNFFKVLKRLKARHRLASKIEDIKCRVISIAERRQRYQHRHIADSGSLSSGGRVDTKWNDRRGDALLLEEAALVGIDNSKRQLIEFLTRDDPALKAVAAVGMGGIGKTTLSKRVYDDEDVKKHFQTHVWVNVSQSFVTMELLKNILKQLYGEIKEAPPRNMDRMECTELKREVKEFLQSKRFIIVLDDLWDSNAWDAIKHAFPDGGCGSRLMLTTRNTDVAAAATTENNGYVYSVRALSTEESWNLFCQKTFMEDSCPSYLQELSQRILRRCQGLPLAIVSIGGLLRTKRKEIDDWVRVDRSLGAELESNDKLKSIKKILLLSYHDLPSSLKPCFLYVSIFLEDCLIKRNKLIRLWIAEGFVEEKEGQTPEEVAESYLNELVNRGLIKIGRRTRNRRVSTCRIHDLWREIALSKVRDLNFAAIVNEKSCIWPEKIRRLSVHGTTENIPKKRFSHLRSLLMFKATELSMTVPYTCHLTTLRVLDLEGMPLENFPEEVLNLTSLTYLCLRQTKVRKIPSSIGRLANLETLDLKHANVTELPDDIVKLRRLRHLLVYRYGKKSSSPFHATQSFRAPCRLGCLTSLQKLCFIEAAKKNGILVELGNLTQLRRLGITKLKREDGSILCSSIEKMPDLRSLDINSSNENEILDLQSMNSPPCHLQRLWLQGPLEKLPRWIPSLHGLVKIRLRWSRLKDDPLESLKTLPNLVELQLRQAYDGDELVYGEGGFQALKILHLHDLQGLKRIKVEEGALSVIEEMRIIGCKLLEEVPSGIENLKRLRSLCFCDMENKLVRELSSKQGENHLKISSIKQKHYICRNQDQWIQIPL